MGQLRSMESRKGKENKKSSLLLLLKAKRYKGIAPNQLQVLFTQTVPPTGSGGRNRLRVSQGKGTDAGRYVPELTAMVCA